MNCEELSRQVRAASQLENKLLLVVGPAGSGKSRLLRQLSGAKYINVRKELKQDLWRCSKERWADQLIAILRELIGLIRERVVILDNIEKLFSPALNVDALKILVQLSREKTVVAAWTGFYRDGKLSWGEAGQADYRVVDTAGFPGLIVALQEANSC